LLYPSELNSITHAHLVVGRIPKASCDEPLGFGVDSAFGSIPMANKRALQALDEHAYIIMSQIECGQDLEDLGVSDSIFKNNLGCIVVKRDMGNGGEGGEDKLVVSVERRAIQLPPWSFSFPGCSFRCSFPAPWPTGMVCAVLFRARRSSHRLPSDVCLPLLSMLACGSSEVAEAEEFRSQRRRI